MHIGRSLNSKKKLDKGAMLLSWGQNGILSDGELTNTGARTSVVLGGQGWREGRHSAPSTVHVFKCVRSACFEILGTKTLTK